MAVRKDYKQTDVGVIPEDWEVKKLSELCRLIVDGTHFTPKYVNNGIPFYSVENVTGNNFTDTKFISPEEHAKLVRRCKAEKGDILLTRIGSLGETKLLDWDVDASIYVSLALLKPRDSVIGNYLYSYSKSRQFVKDIEKRSLINATPQKINMGDIGNVPIPIPRDETEQRAIAAALSDVDALLAALDALIAKKRLVKQGAMQELLTGKRRLPGFSGEWETKQLGGAAAVVMGQSPVGTSYNRNGIGAPLINGPTEFTDKYPIKIQWTSQPTKFCKNGDLLLCVRGSSTGRINISNDEYCIGRGVAAIRAKAGADTSFITFQVDSAIKSILTLTTGSTFPNIDGKSIRAIEFVLPSLAEQQAIAEILTDIDAEIAALEGRREKTRLIKQGMMQELLTGRIRLEVVKV